MQIQNSMGKKQAFDLCNSLQLPFAAFSEIVKTQPWTSRGFRSTARGKLFTWGLVYWELSNKYKAILGSQISGRDCLWYGQWRGKRLPGSHRDSAVHIVFTLQALGMICLQKPFFFFLRKPYVLHSQPWENRDGEIPQTCLSASLAYSANKVSKEILPQKLGWQHLWMTTELVLWSVPACYTCLSINSHIRKHIQTHICMHIFWGWWTWDFTKYWGSDSQQLKEEKTSLADKALN